MPNIKTAISINKALFNEVDLLAKKLNVSRSSIFSKAVHEYIQNHNNKEVLEQINKFCDEQPNEDSYMTKMKEKHIKIIADKW